MSAVSRYLPFIPKNQARKSNNKTPQTTPITDPTLAVCSICKELLNNCLRSQIDHSKEISLAIYAISILVVNKNNKLGNIFSHHTILIIEGFTARGKFWQKAHLMGTGSSREGTPVQDCFSGHSNIGQVQLTEEKYSYFDPRKFKEYRQTWTISQEKVQTLLAQVIWEQNHPEATPFRLLGENSLIAVTREFVDTRHPDLAALEKTNREKFRNLCNVLKNKYALRFAFKWWWRNTSLAAKVSMLWLLLYPFVLPLDFCRLLKAWGRSLASRHPLLSLPHQDLALLHK